MANFKTCCGVARHNSQTQGNRWIVVTTINPDQFDALADEGQVLPQGRRIVAAWRSGRRERL